MEIDTSRFGTLNIETESVIRFPFGLFGFEDCREWILLPDEQNCAVAWLQSVDYPEMAFAAVNPRRFLANYRLRIARRELASLELDDEAGVEVLAIIGRTERSLTLNLKAPLVINVERGLGHQVIANGDLPLRYELESESHVLRRIA